jgi:hypothetical protein
VRVPEEAAAGKAKVTLSISDWRGMNVTTTTGEVLVENPAEPAPDPKSKQ